MAAMYGSLSKAHDEDEFMFLDGICDTVIKLAMEQKNIEGNPIFKECMFFISILITTVKVKQLVQYLLNTDVIDLLMSALSLNPQTSISLHSDVLDALHLIFQWDMENAPEKSIRGYFEGKGGMDLLNQVATTSRSLEVQTQSLEILGNYFKED